MNCYSWRGSFSSYEYISENYSYYKLAITYNLHDAEQEVGTGQAGPRRAFRDLRVEKKMKKEKKSLPSRGESISWETCFCFKSDTVRATKWDLVGVTVSAGGSKK